MTSLRYISAPMAVLALSGCQLISGLSNLEEGTGGGGTTTSSSSTSGSTTAAPNCYVCTAADSCANQTCATMSFGTGTPPTSIASDGTYLYWGTAEPVSGSGGAIHRFEIDNIAHPSRDDIVTNVSPSRIAADAHTVYWIDLSSHRVMSAASTAQVFPSPATPLFPIEQNSIYLFAAAERLTLVGESLYWTVGGNTVYRGTTDATADPAKYDMGNSNPFGVDPDNVFFSDGANILRLDPTSLTAPINILPGTNATQVTTDTTSTGDVYFVRPGSANSSGIAGQTQILRAPKGGGPSETIAEAPFVGAILADKNYVYWTRSDAAPPWCTNVELFAIPMNDTKSAPLRLAIGLSTCDPGLAQDDDHIFWLGESSIEWIRKPPK